MLKLFKLKKPEKLSNYAALATATMLPAMAFAEAPAAPDTSGIVTYIGYAVGAVVAIGAAKMIPSAAIWLYSALGSMIRRG